MAPTIDYDALRKQTLGSGDGEAVTVNTRALIDKVLARYSGEWTTLRELLQNASDASSKRVKITIETLPSATVPVPQAADLSSRLRHVLQHHTTKCTRVDNDGLEFSAKDWARLKKIAEGNPDETKIGAFGVGFYSVFADSEEPFISSGREALAFYWKGDALFTKSLKLPEEQKSKTTFILPNRNRDSPVPNLLSLCRFLASSLTFVGLEQVELWLDEWKIISLNKMTAPSAEVYIPKEVNRQTKEGLMNVAAVKREAAQLHAEWIKAVEWKVQAVGKPAQDSGDSGGRAAQSAPSLRSFFHRLAPGTSNSALVEKQAREERETQKTISEDLMGTMTATIFVHVNRATIKTQVPRTFATELERATKKPPPKETTIALLSASYDEHQDTEASNAKIFDSFLPSDGKGRIFIGFTTNQTTGLNIHISTPSVIPTVERESIDLVNRYIKTWNIELLRVAGIVSRIAWAGEMDAVQNKIMSAAKANGRSKTSREDAMSVLPEAIYLHKAYNWSETTPSPEVGRHMEEAFWTCNSKVTVSILSTKGVLPASQIRLEPEDLSFVDDIPSLPKELLPIGMVKKLIDYGLINEVTISDIKNELESKALNLKQLKEFLGWILQKVRIQEINVGIARTLLDVAIVNDDESDPPAVIVLSEKSHFLNPSRISAEMPMPPFVLPFKLTAGIDKSLLGILFEDLQLVPWLRWIMENAGGRGALPEQEDVTQNPKFAALVLSVISKQWEGLSQSSKGTVISILETRTIMPTKLGMKKPSEAYFASVKLFDDLPVVVGLNAVKEKILVALGVRKTIEVNVIIERLMVGPKSDSSAPSPTRRWNHVDLIKYLASVQSEIPPADLKFLRNAKICPAETEALQPTKELFLISALYQPEQALRQLNLLTLQWPGVFRLASAEGRFLLSLGLRTHPSYEDLIAIMAQAASNDQLNLRDRALKYFIDHHQTKGYASQKSPDMMTRYLPVEGDAKKVASSSQVFVNEKAAVLGFMILRRDLQVHSLKFGVKQDPPLDVCIDRVIHSPPDTQRSAREYFDYLAGRVSEFSNTQADKLGSAKIIPVPVSRSRDAVGEKQPAEKVKFCSAAACFLGHGDSRYADIFDYVDFGNQANSLLLRIGSKHEPSITELARRLVIEPARLFSVLGDSRYMDLLRNIADSWSVLRKDKTLIKDLRASQCLLAYKEISTKPRDGDQDDDDESSVKSWTLTTAKQIVIIDDIITFNRFKEVLLAAPMEETLETLYHSLGSPEVSTLLHERQSLGNPERDQTPALKMQQLLHERIRLYLHDYRSEAIKHDHNWVQKRLTVECVHSISLTQSLEGYSIRRKVPKQAVMSSEKPILYITPRIDMLEVSQAIAPLILQRVKPQSIFMLEMMLESSLNQLGRRGYNVQRILNQKAREFKVAEERRKQQEMEERERMKQREKEWQEQQTVLAANAASEPQMPGDFPSSPEHHEKARQQQQETTGDNMPMTKPKSLLSGLGKRFNFDQMSRTLSQVATSGRENRAIESPPQGPPPPYSQEDRPRETKVSKPEGVTAPHRVQQNLMSLIQDSRAHNANSLQSNSTYNDVKETSSYCDSKPAHNITYIGSTEGVRVFLDKDAEAKGLTAEKFLAANASALQLFASVLFSAAESFALKRNAVHIFYDDSGSTIAFNSNKALFFNYRYFENLHLPTAQQGNKSEAVVYWSVVMAHELAHNVVSDHSSQHSYYTESLVTQYFPKIVVNAGISAGNTVRLQDPVRLGGSEQRLVDVE